MWANLKPSATTTVTLQKEFKLMQREQKSDASETTDAIFSFMPLSKKWHHYLCLGKSGSKSCKHNFSSHIWLNNFRIQIITQWSVCNPDPWVFHTVLSQL